MIYSKSKESGERNLFKEPLKGAIQGANEILTENS